MKQALFVRRSASAAVLLLSIAFSRSKAQQVTSGDLAGLVVGDDDKPVTGATTSATQLSTVEVCVSPTEIDSRSTEIAQTIRIDDVKLVPMGRTATDLVALVPGATKDFVYGGASYA